MPKRNYGFEKRQKELAKVKKREEKRQRRAERGPSDPLDPLAAPDPDVDSDSADTPEVSPPG